MATKITATAKPLFLVLLPLFFVWHGWVEYFPAIPAIEALKLAGIYILAAFLLTGIAWLFYRDIQKAAFLAFCLLAFQFFFGSLHDFLQTRLGETFFPRYSFLLPFFGLVFGLLAYRLAKSKTGLQKTTRYLNILLIILVLVDAGMLLLKSRSLPPKPVAGMKTEFMACDTCATPDVYLIIADEYAGKSALRDLFAFDNSAFEAQLHQRGFHVIGRSNANYNATVYSMASMLGMDYLRTLEDSLVNHPDMLACRDAINHNNVLDFFRHRGYDIHNYSFFEFAGQKNRARVAFFPSRISFLTAQTFTRRFQHDLGFHFAPAKKLEKIKKNNLYNTGLLDSLTRQAALAKTTVPKFVYTHLAIPHHPYYFDSLGREVETGALTDEFKFDRGAYIQNLVYTNKKLLSLVDHILANSSRPPVIILAGDHGFRQFREATDKKYYFMNLAAVLLPNRNYAPFYDSMSNVNLFRAILNAQFGQNLAYKKDSTVFLHEP